MFADFLCDRADVRPIIRPDTSNRANRTKLDQMCCAPHPEREDVPCRIRGDKIIFPPDVELEIGDEIVDRSSGDRYQVTDKKRVRGKTMIHHRTYAVRRWPYGNE